RGGHVGRDAFGLGREAILEIGVHRHANARGNCPQMRERNLERDLVVAAADGPCQTRAGRGERREPEVDEEPRAADIPRVRNDEAARLVEPAELGDSRACPERSRGARPERSRGCHRASAASMITAVPYASTSVTPWATSFAS